jgi:hypothetical protein
LVRPLACRVLFPRRVTGTLMPQGTNWLVLLGHGQASRNAEIDPLCAYILIEASALVNTLRRCHSTVRGWSGR